MSTPILILGESGTGKSDAMRNLDPAKTLLIQATPKKLPFKVEGWKVYEEGKGGNIFVTDKAADIISLLQGTKKKIIVLDDYQYVLSNELLKRWRETGYGKFSEVGYNGLNIIQVANSLPNDVHVYIMAHSETGDDGITRIKTPGKLMSNYNVEGLFSMVLRTCVRDDVYYFATKNSGSDTVKSPREMFAEELISNDLLLVDKAITDFGW